jgi:pimeloyl-ACP methyl ester carboxylesterase
MIRGSFHQPPRDPAQVDRVVGRMTSMRQEIALPLLDAMFHYDSAASLDSVTLPIRCINSGDRTTDLAAGRRHAKRFDARTIPGVGHYLMLEDSEAFNALLDAAIDDLVR